MRPARKTPSKARAALLWAVLLFAVGQLALGLFVYRRHPELRESAYSVRLHRLQDRIAEGKGKPLILVLGSSRPVFGFRPSLVKAACPPRDDDPILFNFAFVGSGPVREWMMLRRILADGVRPDCVLVEAWAPFLTQTGMFDEEMAVFGTERHWSDIALLARFYHKRWEAADSVIEKHLTPAVHHRLGLLNCYAPSFLPLALSRQLQTTDLEWGNLDECGARAAYAGKLSEEERFRAVDRGYGIMAPVIEKFRINERSDGAFHGLLDECRSRGIKVVLFVMPEHSALRAVYPPRVQALFHRFLAQLRDEYRVPVIDARTWCRDEEFGDMGHVLETGAKAFSNRFGREVYPALREGRSLPNEVLFQEDARLTSGPLPTVDKR